MNKIARVWQHWGIATRQFIVLSSVSLALVLSLAAVNAIETVRTLQNQLMQDSQLFITQSNQYLDSYVNNVENILLMVSSRHDLFAMPQSFKTEKILQQYASMDGDLVQTIYLVRPNGTVLTNAPVQYSILGNPFLPKLTHLATQNYGSINWSEPYNSPVSGQTVAFVRSVKNADGSLIGTVIIEINIASLTNSLASVLSGTFENFLVISIPNQVVTYNIEDSLSPFETNTLPPRVEQSLVNQLRDAPPGISSTTYQGIHLSLVKSDTNMLGWSIVDVIKRSMFYANMNDIFRNFAVVTGILLLVLLVSSFWLSRHFTAPVRNLIRTMGEKINIDNPKLIESRRSDEIGRLVRSYNRLMIRISELVKEVKDMEQRKKEYELKMLQSQIGPHFLYNTLMCIGTLARRGKLDDLNETIRSLISLISFSFDKVSAFVSLEDEIGALKMYLQIQRIRYGNKFDVLLDVDEDMLGCQIPRLTMQPIVENAIFHGIVPLESKGTIIVRARIQSGTLRILIFDNGVGMDKTRAYSVLSDPAHEGGMSYGLSQIGTRNVHERLQMYFGDDFGIRVRSAIGRGTVVRLSLPAYITTRQEYGITAIK